MTAFHTPGHLQERRDRFDEFIDNTKRVVAELDESHFEPEILPVIRQLGQVCELAFMPDISDEGLVSFPEEAQLSEGFAIIPLLDQAEVLRAGASLGMPTMKRIADAAAAYDLSPSDVYDACREEVATRPEGYWFDELCLPDDGKTEGAATGNYYGEQAVDGKRVFLVSRPYVLVGPRVSQQSPVIQGVAGTHELIHAVDKQNESAPNHIDDIERDEINTVAWLEQRGYHGAYGALMSTDSEFADKIHSGRRSDLKGMPAIAAEVEWNRRAHALPGDKFKVTPSSIVFLTDTLHVLSRPS